MFIRYLDYLSPPISIYYKGNLTHSSIVSGIVSIISIMGIIYLAVYFSLDLINKENPNAFYYNSYIPDAGTFEINSSSLFHFINIQQNIRGIFSHETFNFTIFNIIGFEGALDNFLSIPDYDTKMVNHWLYGPCNRDIHGKDVKNLIEPYNFFEQCACIQKYFDHKSYKYYEIGDPNFRWPSISHGTNHEQTSIYSLFITKCNKYLINEILGDNYQCLDNSSFPKYFRLSGVRTMNLYFINNYIDVLNYHNPYSKFFYKITEVLKPSQYTFDDVNINPSLITTYDGIALYNKKEEISYVFDRNSASIVDNSGINLYMGYTFYLRNTMMYYQRTYKKIQDIISSIGGISQVINIVAMYLNRIYNNFIVLYDTEDLLNSLITAEKRKYKKDSKKKNSRSKIKQLNASDIKKNSSRKSIFEEEKKAKNKNNKSENDIGKSALRSNNMLFNSTKGFEDLKSNINNVDIAALNKIETYKIDTSKKKFLEFSLV
jgi:hypothetical protein